MKAVMNIKTARYFLVTEEGICCTESQPVALCIHMRSGNAVIMRQLLRLLRLEDHLPVLHKALSILQR